MHFYNVPIIEKQQELWYRVFQTDDAKEVKRLRTKIDKLDKSIEAMAQQAHAAFDDMATRLPESLQEVYTQGQFHDCVLLHIRVRKYRTAKRPTIEVKISFDSDTGRQKGIIFYRNVHSFYYNQTYNEDYTHYECLFSELFMNAQECIEHNFLLDNKGFGELHIECESVEWKGL